MVLLKSSKALGLLLLVIQVAGMLAFVVSVHTIFAVIRSAVPNGGQVIPVEIDENTGMAKLTFTMSPGNGGFIGASLSVQVGIVAPDGQYLAMNSTKLYLDPGSRKNIEMTLKVPVERFNEYAAGGGTSLEVQTGVRTLQDLVGFSTTIRAKGGGQ
ncbi:hypothetical protein MUO93_10800 [Candidatus Bathyarchaeota archaeon]|nr:hypothetical protein [Candidatus Bathyarchaeota archaeon]